MSSRGQLPTLAELPSLPEAEQAQILDLLFEPSPALLEVCRPALHEKASSWQDLIYHGIGGRLSDLHKTLQSSSDSKAATARQTLDSILGSHPRLGAKKVESAASSAEQAHLKARSSEEESRRLAELNAEYESKFPGLIFVVFVNGRPRTEIMDVMQQRIKRGDIEAEREASIKAMVDIAWDRAKKFGAAA